MWSWRSLMGVFGGIALRGISLTCWDNWQFSPSHPQDYTVIHVPTLPSVTWPFSTIISKSAKASPSLPTTLSGSTVPGIKVKSLLGNSGSSPSASDTQVYGAWKQQSENEALSGCPWVPGVSVNKALITFSPPLPFPDFPLLLSSGRPSFSSFRSQDIL